MFVQFDDNAAIISSTSSGNTFEMKAHDGPHRTSVPRPNQTTRLTDLEKLAVLCLISCPPDVYVLPLTPRKKRVSVEAENHSLNTSHAQQTTLCTFKFNTM